MDKNAKTTYMSFPCDFPLKIIGKNQETLKISVMNIIAKHFSGVEDKQVTITPSQNGNYLSISVVLHVQDQPSLDALYLELTKHPDIKMVL